MVLLKSRFRLPGLATVLQRSRAGLWFPEYGHVVDRRNNVLAVLRRPRQDGILIPGCNIVTDAGDVHIAELGSGEVATNAFTTWAMASAGTPGKAADDDDFTLIAGSLQAQDGTYPQTDDGDGDNTGAGVDVRTTRVSYTAAAFNHAAITHGYITNASPGVAEPLYAGWAWASSINKTASDTLKAFHNTTMNGV
jgi:hypothetical protein